jgi:ribosomal protein S6--L-glutamate ligase
VALVVRVAALLAGAVAASAAAAGTEAATVVVAVTAGAAAAARVAAARVAAATDASAVIGTRTAVDVVETADGPMVFEVSAFGGFRGLKESRGFDVAQRYVDYVIHELTHGPTPRKLGGIGISSTPESQSSG